MRSFFFLCRLRSQEAIVWRNDCWWYLDDDMIHSANGFCLQSCCRSLGCAQAPWAGRRWSPSSPSPPRGPARGLRLPGHRNHPAGMLPRPCGSPPSASSLRRTRRSWTWWSLWSECTPRTPWDRPSKHAGMCVRDVSESLREEGWCHELLISLGFELDLSRSLQHNL